jgi:hypothetical protein
MSEVWHIKDTFDGKILEVCRTARKAQRAQARWHKLWLWKRGPLTTVRRVAIRDEDDR